MSDDVNAREGAGHALDPDWDRGPWSSPEGEVQQAATATMKKAWKTLDGLSSTGRALSETIVPKESPVSGPRQSFEAKPAPLVVDEEVIGRGGMSVVRVGRQPSLGRTVAVKELPDGNRGERASLELLREAWITGRLEHPNVMPVYDIDIDERGKPRLVLKRIEGVSWAHLLERPAEVRMRFGVAEPTRWHLQVFVQVCNAVHFAHSHDVLHRDLKPENVMIGSFGEVYVLDWGIAVKGEDGVYDVPSEIVGTPAYIAPEMVTCERQSPRTDVYLLGGLLHEILTGLAPHRGDTMQEIIWSALTAEHELEGVPEGIAAVVRRCLEREPEDRFGSAEEVRRAVLEAQEREESEALAQAGLDDLRHLEALDSEALNGDSAETKAEDSADEVHDRFGACRFAFQTALERWPGNPVALDGLIRAKLAMVSHALSRGDIAEASQRLAKLDHPPEDLLRRVREAEERVAEEQDRIKKLERFSSDLDKNVARTARFWLILALGAIWVCLPIAQHVFVGPDNLNPVTGTFLPLLYCSVAAGALYWRRESMWANRYNRRLWTMLLIGLGGEFLFDLGHLIREVEGLQILINDMAFRAVNIAMAALFVERTLVVAATIYAGAYLVATAFPDVALLGVAISDVALVATLAYRWRPRRGQRNA